MKNRKGFTLIELIIVLMIVFTLLLVMGGVFVIPWALNKYVGDAKIVNGNANQVPLVDGTAKVISGQKFKVEIEPPFLSTEKITANIAAPPPGAKISKQFGGNKFWLIWKPEEVGIVEVEIEFSDGNNSGKTNITIDVVDN